MVPLHNVFMKLQKALIMGFFFIGHLYAQESQTYLDSLTKVYESKSFKGSEELIILKELVTSHKDSEEIIKYSDLLLEKAFEVDSTQYLFSANLQKGYAYSLKSNLSKALEYYQIAAKIATDTNEKDLLALANLTIGGVYSDIGNFDLSIEYSEKGILQLRESIKLSTNQNDMMTFKNYLASALLNTGDLYRKSGKYEKALGYFYESSGLCQLTNYDLGTAYNHGNIGMVYAKQKKYTIAEANLKEAIRILKIEEDYYPIPVYLNQISQIYFDLNQMDIAEDYAQQSYDLAHKNQSKEQIIEANLQMAKIYEKTNQPNKSLYYYQNYVSIKDSINTLATVQKLASQRTEFEVAQKQVELDLERQKRKNEKILTYSFLGGMLLVSGLALGLYRRNKYISKTRKIIDEEKKKSDSLLLNILPRDTADELKLYGKVEAKKYDSVTVLFTDFGGFTKIAENASPEKLVESVDMYFSEFDKIMAKYKLEKIKTIGDAYMCAGGLPQQSDNHAHQMAKAALDILDFVHKSKQMHAVSDLRFDVRIGIHTGPVVAGVVGKDKFSYDIWGDTVNVASRIESSSEPGRINVSESTYELLKNKYSFESRGEIKIKNRSPVKMYYLSKN